MPKIFTHGLFTKHIGVTPSLSLALQSSVTELILAYFPSGVSSTQKDAVIAHLKNFEEDELKGLSGIEALSYGWGVEQDFPVKGGPEDQRASILVSFIGFDSIDAQRIFKQSLTFEKLLGLVRNMEGIFKLENISVDFRSLSRNTEKGNLQVM